VLAFWRECAIHDQGSEAKLERSKASLPKGVEVVETYDRSALDRSRCGQPLAQAAGGVSGSGAGVHPVPVAPAFGAGRHHHPAIGIPRRVHRHAHAGHQRNIMSLGGIAIAIGAMVDAAVVMIENAHKKLEHYRHANAGAMRKAKSDCA